ncbi:MAG: site-2 protease family protein [Microthrixaceae bacterium]
MTANGIRLGRIFGIEVSANVGVLAIAALLTWSLAQGVLPAGSPGHVPVTYWSVAFVVSILFLFSLLAHELAHSVIARRNGITVEGIHLWLFGGISQLKSDPKTPGAEFRITAVGPGTSLLLGALAWGAAYGMDALGAPSVYVVGLSWLGIINLFLGAFNLLPGAPLDGGRLVAALLWKLRRDKLSGQIGAAKVGRVVGLGIIALGAFEVFQIESLSGLWTMFIGWFLLSAARNEQRHYELERALGAVTVANTMELEPKTASPLSTISQVATDVLVPGRQSAVPILNWDGRLVALVTMAELARIPREQWGLTTALAAAGAGVAPVTAEAGEILAVVLERLARAGASHAVVLHDGNVVGLIGPEQIENAARAGSGDYAGTGR